MSYPLSGCLFIKNTFQGAFMAPESIAQFLPFCEDITIMDLGSTDGTIEFLREIADHNHKIKVILEDNFPRQDAGVFADLANTLIDFCQHSNVLYWQADEIWHENLLHLMEEDFKQGHFDLSFWRIQFANNFQYVKWFPHLVHRVGYKGKDIRLNTGKENFEFNGDGMNTTRMWDAKICSHYGGEMFPQWGGLGQEGIKPYVGEMITDVSLLGGFRDVIPQRRALHAPLWHEEPSVPYYDKQTGTQLHYPASKWIEKANQDNDWVKTTSPYNLPKLLQYHVGKTKYELRPELLEAIRNDTTRTYAGI